MCSLIVCDYVEVTLNCTVADYRDAHRNREDIGIPYVDYLSMESISKTYLKNLE